MFFKLSSTNDDDNTHSSKSFTHHSDFISTTYNVITTKGIIASHNLANSNSSRGHPLPMIITLDVNYVTDGLHYEDCFNLANGITCVVRIDTRSSVASLHPSHDKDVPHSSVSIADGNNSKLSLF